MKVTEMDLLLRVAETGSMTVAARQMHLTPAAVSAAVARAEEALGVRLFERTTRSLHPTDEGLKVLEGCQAVVARWAQTLESVQGTHQELAGTVHITAPADTTYQVLAPALARLSAAHPALQVVMHSSDSVQHLHRDAIDMAIRYGPLQDSTLSARRLAHCPVILVASPSYLASQGTPATPDDLANHRALTLQLSDTAVTAWTLSGRKGRRQVPLRSPLCGDGHLARQWALTGMGIACKSLFDVIDDLEAGQLVQVLGDYTAGPQAIHAVFPSRRYLPLRVRALDLAVTEAFQARMQRCEAWLERQMV